MAKQQNCKPQKSSQPKSSGSGEPGARKQIRKISVPAPGGKHVGPRNSPYYEKI